MEKSYAHVNPEDRKNFAPSTQSVPGPNANDSRAIDEKGRFTANPNAKPNQPKSQKDEDFLAKQKPYIERFERGKGIRGKGFTMSDNERDKTISEPVFKYLIKKKFIQMYENDREEGQVTVFKHSTEYEDLGAKFDFFLGNASSENTLLINEDEVERIDLKTGFLLDDERGRRAFESPTIKICFTKLYIQNGYSFNPTKTMFNGEENLATHLAFQFLLSEQQSPKSVDDIVDAKCYYTNKENFTNFLKNNSLESLANELTISFSKQDVSRFEELVKSKGLELTYTEFEKENAWKVSIPIASDPTKKICLLFEQQKTGDSVTSVRFMMPARYLKELKELSSDTYLIKL